MWRNQSLTDPSMWNFVRWELSFVAPHRGTVIGVIEVLVDGLMIISTIIVINALFCAVRGTWHTSMPEILGGEKCHKVDVALETN